MQHVKIVKIEHDLSFSEIIETHKNISIPISTNLQGFESISSDR